MKKRFLAGLVCGMLTASVGLAAPQVEVPKGQLNAELTYTRTSNELGVDYGGHNYDAENFLRNVFDDASGDFDGHIFQTGLTYGLNDGYALYVGYGNGKTHTLNFMDETFASVGVSGKFDILDLQVQKKLDKNFAAFLGVKQFQSAISLNVDADLPSDPPISLSESFRLENDTKRMLEAGFIGQAALGSKADAFAKIGVGNNLFEYKAGVNFKLSKNVGFELGYNYLKIKDLRNPLADALVSLGTLEHDYNAKFTSKGIYYGLNVNF